MYPFYNNKQASMNTMKKNNKKTSKARCKILNIIILDDYYKLK
jgi:hypothetical protein